MKFDIRPKPYKRFLGRIKESLRKKEAVKTLIIIALIAAFLLSYTSRTVKPEVRLQCLDGSFRNADDGCPEITEKKCPEPEVIIKEPSEGRYFIPEKIDSAKIQEILRYDPYKETGYSYSSHCKLEIRRMIDEVSDTKSVYDKLWLKVDECNKALDNMDDDLEEALGDISAAIRHFKDTVEDCRK